MRMNACLDANLRALMEAAPRLASRLALPVRGDHVTEDASGTPLRDGRPFVVGPEGVSKSLATLEGVAPEQDLFVFGIGLGEQLSELLENRPLAQVLVWDRDPWLVRQTLSRWDWADELSCGRLRICMGADLVEQVPRLGSRALLLHPELASLYEEELQLVREGVGPRRAIIGLGGLMVADLGDALRTEGYTVVPVDFRGWAREELEHAFERIAPELVLAVNYVHGLAEFCQAQGRPLLCWEIDPSTDRVGEPEGPLTDVFLFTFRRANVPVYRSVGFPCVQHLPLAAESEKRCVPELDAAERERYAAPVSFVGSSMVAPARAHLTRFIELYTEWHPDGEDVRTACERQIEEILAIQAQDFGRYVLPELAFERFEPFLKTASERDLREDPLALLAEVAASRKRIAWVSGLAWYGIHVWGDPGWETAGIQYRGRAGHYLEVPRIYTASQINIDIGRVYQADIVTLRVFDVLACGGFLIAEHSDDLEQLFEVGREVESYTTLQELKEKVGHYLAHPAKARELAARGQRAVRERHRLGERVRHMLDVAGLVPPVEPAPR